MSGSGPADVHEPRWRDLLRPVVVLFVLGYLYGLGTGHLPPSSDPDAFWVANVGAAYVVLPFAGSSWLVHRRAAPLLAGMVSGSAVSAGMVCGFYRLHAVGRDPHADPGHPESVVGAYRRWFAQFVLGVPGGAPWLGLALVVGAVAGVCAWAWLVRGSTAAGIAGVLPLVLEPVYRFSVRGGALPLLPGFPVSPRNAVLWAGELLLGAVAVLVVLRSSRGSDPVVGERPDLSRAPE